MRALTLLTFVLIAGTARAGAELPRSKPEEQGVSSAAILDFIDAADTSVDSLHSFMLVRHGQVIAEGWWAPYDAESRHSLYSLSKSFTSTAVGMAVAEGKLSVDDPIIRFFPDDVPAQPSANLKSMRISDLLRMSTGQQAEPARGADEAWTKTFLNSPVAFKPGTHFLYNTSATYMLSAAVQKVTGQTVLDYLKPRLFEPLGIEKPTWETSPQGISTGGYGLSVRTEDIAKFGQLYLQKGRWGDKQLVSRAWIEDATARQTSNGSNPKSDWDQGYGYQFWRCRHGAYRGDGAFGQYCVVLPEQDAVIAMTGGLRDMQAVLNLVWDKLLPGMKPDALPADPETRAKLVAKLKNLSLHLPEASGTPAKVIGKKFVFPANDRKLESLALEAGTSDANLALILRVNGADQRILCGNGKWEKGKASWGKLPEGPAAAVGAWTAKDAYTAKLCFYETPFVITIRLAFSGDEVRYETDANVGFGQTKEAPLVGKVP
jgi:CubicO group peptidase (beta-lactamase class C family)